METVGSTGAKGWWENGRRKGLERMRGLCSGCAGVWHPERSGVGTTRRLLACRHIEQPSRLGFSAHRACMGSRPTPRDPYQQDRPQPKQHPPHHSVTRRAFGGGSERQDQGECGKGEQSPLEPFVACLASADDRGVVEPSAASRRSATMSPRSTILPTATRSAGSMSFAPGLGLHIAIAAQPPKNMAKKVASKIAFSSDPSSANQNNPKKTPAGAPTRIAVQLLPRLQTLLTMSSQARCRCPTSVHALSSAPGDESIRRGVEL